MIRQDKLTSLTCFYAVIIFVIVIITGSVYVVGDAQCVSVSLTLYICQMEYFVAIVIRPECLAIYVCVCII